MSLKIKVWNGSERYSGFTTGVGKHVIHMVSGLARKPGVALEMVIPRDHWARDQHTGATGPLSAVRVKRHPLDRRMAEGLWVACSLPALDDASTDWVYAPRERFAPTQTAKSIVTVHDVYAFERNLGNDTQVASMLTRLQLGKALSRADIVAVVSSFTAERLQALFGTPASKIVVVGNGVEDHFFQPPSLSVASFASHLPTRYVLSVGGLTHKKGAPHVLALARTLASSAPDIGLAVTGPVEPAYAAEADTLGNLHLLGRGYANEQMHALIASAQTVVVLSEYEGFGIPALEAMAAGVPVVAARRSSLPEIVQDAGLLVEPTQSPAMRDAVLAVIDDQRLRADLVARGRVRADASRWASCVDRLHAAMTGGGSSR